MTTTISTPSGMPVGAQVVRYGEAVQDFFKFCEYTSVQDETNQRIIPFELWKHQKLIILDILYYRLLALVKPKQIGASAILGRFHLWLCHRPSTKVLCLSAGQTMANSLLDKSRFVNQNLPTWLQLKVGLGADGLGEIMTFPTTRSQILALPSTIKAGLGETASHVTSDEVDFHDYAVENYKNIKPPIDAGATHCEMSTSERTKPASLIKGHYRAGKDGTGNYHPLFLPWWCRPDRDMAWYNRTKKDYPALWMFQQDYPSTEDEALASVEGEGLFDISRVSEMLRSNAEPLERRGNGVYIFHQADPKVKYYAGADCSEGKGGDFQCLWIEGEYQSQRFLAAIIHTNHATPDIFANMSIQLLQEYHRPIVVCGNDAYGAEYLKYLTVLGYNNIHDSDPGKKQGYNERENNQNKDVNLLKFSKSIGDGLVVGYKPALHEMLAFNLIEGHFICSAPHDDCVSAGKLATLAREFTPTSEEVERDSYY